MRIAWVTVLALTVWLACSGEESDEDASSGSGTTSQAAGGSTAAATGGSGGAGQGGGGAVTGGGGAASFACGTGVACKHGVEYCEIFYPGVPDSDPTYTCQPLPPGCQPDPSCSCIGGGPPCSCEESAEGDLTLTCAGA